MGEKALGIAAALDAWAPLIAQGYEVPAASKALHDAARHLRAQHSVIESLQAALSNISRGSYDGIEVTHSHSARDLRNMARAALSRHGEGNG